MPAHSSPKSASSTGEASVSLYSDFGTLSMGRMGGVGSGAGTYDLVLATADAFDGGDNNVFGFATSDRYDNMVTYQTPKFAGLQATVQYSFNEDSVEETAREGSSAVNRYSSAALTGDFGALQTVLAYEFQNYKSFGAAAEHDDGQIVYLGGNYDCGFAKTFVMGQYFKGIKAGQLTAITEDDADRVDSASSGRRQGLRRSPRHDCPGCRRRPDGCEAYFTDFAVEYATGDKDADELRLRCQVRVPPPSARPSTRVPASPRSSMTMKALTRRLQA
ncbi:MAG: porin [Sutterella wadsworthensis]